MTENSSTSLATPTQNDSGHRGRPGYSREDVIRIAVAEFNAYGYEATSMGKLAQRLGLTKSAIYHHVSSKEEILVEATSRALELLTKALDEAALADGGPRKRLEAAIVGATRVLCTCPDEVTLLLRLRGNTDVEEELMERRRGITRDFVTFVRDAQEDGVVRTDLDAGLAGRLTLGTVNSLTEWYRVDGELGPEELSGAVASLIMKGLLSRA